MTDAIETFFDRLRAGERAAVLAGVTGRMRIDLRSGRAIDHWLIAVERGEVNVSHRGGPADSVVRMERALFEGMVQGRVNAMAATLRGLVLTEGHTNMFVKFQRLFPGPPPKRRPRARADAGGRR